MRATNSITNNPSINFNVSDESEVTSEVYTNGVLALTTNENNFSILLLEGINNIEVRAKDFSGNVAVPLVLSNVKLDTVVPIINSYHKELYFLETVPGVITFAVYVNEPTKFLKSNGIEAQKISEYEYKVTENISVVGKYNLALVTQDLAGNLGSLNAIFDAKVDDVAPVVILAQLPPLTNASQVWVSASVDDESSTETTLKVNGIDVAKVFEKSFQYLVTLSVEGLNTIQVQSRDAAGNVSTSVHAVITRDSTGPVISVNPGSGEVISGMRFTIRGASNEPLSEISVNGKALTLSSDKTSFSGAYVALSQGQNILNYSAKDALGNISTLSTSLTVDDPLLNRNLVSVSPDGDGAYYKIVGRPNAVRSRASVSAEVSVFSFNRDSVIANEDGSFLLKLQKFSLAVLKVEDIARGEKESMELQFKNSTSLAGIIKDVTGNPLVGVTVSFENYEDKVTTDSNGTFRILNSPNGDQKLVVDGSTALASSAGPVRQFNKTAVSVSLLFGKEHTLPRPVYLTPITLDGSETLVSAGLAVTVLDHLNAPGVELKIPAGAAVFPSGSGSGIITIKTIPANKATIAAPLAAEPTNVVALEPSGLKFNVRVDLKLPNENELPAGTDFYILSMNSASGAWELDGFAKVSDDGTSVETKPGFGISHFSLIYAVPVAPVIEEVLQPNLVGIDISKNSMETDITLPSYKILGNSVSPVLKYKSSWANPTAFVSNIFDFPKQEMKLPINQAYTTTSSLRAPIVCVDNPFGGDDWCIYKQYRLDTDTKIDGSVTSSIIPESVRTQFWMGKSSSDNTEFVRAAQSQGYGSIPGSYLNNSIETSPVTFLNPPPKSQISYSVPLKFNNGTYLPSGLYPSLARFEVKYKQLTVRTWTSVTKVSVDDVEYDPITSSGRSVESQVLDKIFPGDLKSKIIVQNKVESAAGRGWNLSGTQKIINPGSSQMLIEEFDGSVATYTVDNTISTLINGNNAYGNIDWGGGFNVKKWPNAIIGKINTDGDGSVWNINLLTKSESLLGNHPRLTGNAYFDVRTSCGIANNGPIYRQSTHFWNTSKFGGFVELPDGTVYGGNLNQYSIFSLKEGLFNKVFGPDLGQIDNNMGFGNWVFPGYPGNQRPWNILPGADLTAGAAYAKVFDQYNLRWGYSGGLQQIGTCNQYPVNVASKSNTGSITPLVGTPPIMPEGSTGYADYWNGSYKHYGGITSPGDMEVSPDGILTYVDTSGYQITGVNLATSEARFSIIHSGYFTQENLNSTITLKNNNYTIENSLLYLFRPKGIAYAATGDLFITTDDGYVMKLSADKKYSRVAGLSMDFGGVLASEAHAKYINLKNPTGLVVDDLNKYLYVADTGNHRVVRIDLKNNLATTVAGNEECSDAINDGQPALSSSLCSPTWLGLDQDKNLVIVDSGHKRIRKVSFSNQSEELVYRATSKDLSTLKRNGDGTFTRRSRNGATAIFNPAGYQTESRDRPGRRTEYEYDNEFKLLAIRDIGGLTTNFFYSAGLLTSISDVANRVTHFTHSGNLLTKVTMPDGSSKNFEYGIDGSITKVIDQNGFPISYVYNQWGRLEKVVDQEAKELKINDSTSKTINVAKAHGTNLNNTNTQVLDKNDNETLITEDANGYINLMKDPTGKELRILRDLDGKILKTTFSDNKSISYKYDPITQDKIETKDDVNNITISQVFDAFGNVVSERDSTGGFRFNTYDPSTGLLVMEELANDVISTVEYNGIGLPSAITKYSDSGAITSTYVYDIYGRVTKSISPDNKSTEFEYDMAGNIVKQIVYLNQNTRAITSFSYDSFNRITKVITAKGEVTQYSYRATGELLSIKDPLNNITHYEYNQRGDLVKEIDPSEIATHRSYDGNGNLIRETDGNGNIKTFEYSSMNRIVKIVLPDDTVEYEYDTRGNASRITNRNQSLSFFRDSRDQLIQESVSSNLSAGELVSYAVNSTFDARGNRNSVSLYSLSLTAAVQGAGGAVGIFTVGYQFDQNKKISSITNNFGANFTLKYDKAQRLTQVVRPGTTTTISFNSGSMIDGIHHRSGNILKSFSEYSYDSRNFPSQRRGPAGTTDYSYDETGRLTSSAKVEFPENFSYDAIGNRISDKGGSYTYSQDRQRLLEDYQFTYLYDNNGNMLRKNSKNAFGKSFIFDYTSSNQIRNVQILDGPFGSVISIIGFKYDPIARRIEKSFDDKSSANKSYVKRFIYDGDNIIAEADLQNRVVAYYTHSSLGMDDILSVHVTSHGVSSQNGGNALNDGSVISKSQGSFYFLKDSLGSVTEITNSDGNIISSYQYNVFGALQSIKDSSGNIVSFWDAPVRNQFTFTGREFEPEMDIYYYRARYYDPQTGRFLQKDPDPGNLINPETFVNKYAYAQNQPARFTDPTGRIVWFYWGAVLLAGILNGVIQAGFNHRDTRGNGTESSDELKRKRTRSAEIGFATGFLSGFFSAMYPVAAPFLLGAGGAINNYVVQNDNANAGEEINPGSIVASGVLGALFGKFAGAASSASSTFTREFAEIGWNLILTLPTALTQSVLPGPKAPSTCNGKAQCYAK